MTDLELCDAFIIMTDLEPDDVVAIVAFLDHLLETEARAAPVTFVVGEGRKSKVGLMHTILRRLGFTGKVNVAGVIDGSRSDKDFPDDIFTAWGTRPGTAEMRTGQGPAGVHAIIAQAAQPFILCLKPPRELVGTAFPRAMMALYGSFNLRSCVGVHTAAQVADWLNTGFRCVILYETFLATGPVNSINRANAPHFWDIMDNIPRYAPIIAHMHAWNRFILNDCIGTAVVSCNRLKMLTGADAKGMRTPDRPSFVEDQLNDVGRIERNLKVVKDILQADYTQMVMADFGLTAYLLGYYDDIADKIKPGTISFNAAGYTVPAEVPTGKVLVVQGVPLDVAIGGITEMMNF
jgi:hypothetical protein